MRVNVVMPQMGESLTEATLTAWLKQPGERVERDEPLFELTTDKVDAEVPSPASGVLVEQLVPVNTTVEINTVVAILEVDGDVATAGRDDSPPQQATGAPEPVALSAPAASPAASAARGISFDLVRPGVGDDAGELRRTRSTPLVRKIAAEHGIEDLSQIPASGADGRVTRQDIEGYIERGEHRAVAPPATAAALAARSGQSQPQQQVERLIAGLPPIEVGARDVVEPMTPQRLAIARHMVASRATSAHAHTVHEIDFAAVSRARRKLSAEFEHRGVKLTFTAFMVKAFAEALSRFPVMNASLDQDRIVYRGGIHIGVAVALNDSLIVPVVRDVDELSLLGVARAVQDVAERARTKRLKPEEVRGGTFTVSNHGVFGPEFGIPVINQPQVAIVATGAIKKRVVVDPRTDAIMVRPTALFCMSFDHRVIDGATADKFLMHVRQVLEGWEV